MKNIILTGAAGFSGANLVETLVDHGYKVFAIVRPDSHHNVRISSIKNVELVSLDMKDISNLPGLIKEDCYAFIHLAWHGARDDMDAQFENIEESLNSVRAAISLGCKKFIGTGSQAEYGVKDSVTSESASLEPITAYGAAKVAAMHLTKILAEKNGLSWNWARIFSLYGRYEPSGRMIPDLIANLKNGKDMHLSSCRQYWDYLDVTDAAEAFVAILEKGRSGEVYNIANGEFQPLKLFVDALCEKYSTGAKVHYGANPVPFISLMPDVSKLKEDTGWEPKVPWIKT